MVTEGVYWTPAHKDAGNRQNGWELLRERLKNVMKRKGPRRFLFNDCRQFIRTVPVLPRDQIDVDNVDTPAEDHVWEARDSDCGIRKKVPQPLRGSLFLRKRGIWNHD